MNSEPNNISAPVVVGMDLTEYYLNVEWDILRVPAERRVKKYPCCPEPYPGKIFYSRDLHINTNRTFKNKHGQQNIKAFKNL